MASSSEGWVDRVRAKAVIKNTLVKQGLAEFLGTFVLVVFGDGADAQFTLGRGEFGTFATVCFGYGLAITMGIMVSGRISGGHINPAVSLAMTVIGRISCVQLLVYTLCQFLGAFLASACLFGVYYDALKSFDGGQRMTEGANATAGIWATYPSAYLSTGGAFGDQVFATFLFLIIIMAVTDERNMTPARSMVPLYIGLAIALIGMSFGINCGFAVNPARDLAPRIFTAMAGWGSSPFSYQHYYFWVPIVGPYLGGVLGVLAYLVFIGFHNREEYEDEVGGPDGEQVRLDTDVDHGKKPEYGTLTP